jgi:hypothetical protein
VTPFRIGLRYGGTRLLACQRSTRFYFPSNGFKAPASSRSASANLCMIFSPEF